MLYPCVDLGDKRTVFHLLFGGHYVDVTDGGAEVMTFNLLFHPVVFCLCELLAIVLSCHGTELHHRKEVRRTHFAAIKIGLDDNVVHHLTETLFVEVSCLYQLLAVVREEFCLVLQRKSHEAHFVKDFLCLGGHFPVGFKELRTIRHNIVQLARRGCHNGGDFVLVVLLFPCAHEVCHVDKLILIEACVKGNLVDGGFVATEIGTLPVSCKFAVAIGFLLCAAGRGKRVLLVILVFHDRRQKASAQLFRVCLEVGITETVGKALLLGGVNGVEFLDVCLGHAFNHALAVDVACLGEIPLMRHTIACEGCTELREVLGKLVVVCCACADVDGRHTDVLSDVAMLGLRCELPLCSEGCGYRCWHCVLLL